jgi:hypothetical protein
MFHTTPRIRCSDSATASSAAKCACLSEVVPRDTLTFLAQRGLAITSPPWEWGETTDQLRTTPAELSAPRRSTLNNSEQWFTLDNR